MGRHVAGDSPAMDRLVEEAITGIGAEVDALHVPRLRGVVLGGGYGRGEGGVFVGPDGAVSLFNDLDFHVVAEEGATEAELAAIGAALAPVAGKWRTKLGIDVDFCAAKTPWRLRHDQGRLMVQELLHGYFDVAGEKGETLFADVERIEPDHLPWMEAARLLMNRGAGLLLAHDALTSSPPHPSPSHLRTPSTPFILRNINKCILGAGDARLIARGGYRWRVEDRAVALGDDLYAKAVEWKFRPRQTGVCDWETARAVWLRAFDEVMAGGGSCNARSLYRAVRWIVRRRTLGDLRTFGLDPVVRILRGMADIVREGRPFPASLQTDWKVFN